MGLRVQGVGFAVLLVALGGCGRKAEPLAAADETLSVEDRRAFAVSPVPEAVPGFAFAADGVGELLRERLMPLQSFVPEPPAFLTGPKSWRAARLGDDSTRATFDSAVEATPRTRVLPQERGSTSTQRAVLDVPPLAGETAPALPAPLLLPAAPLAFATGPEPGRTPVTELSAPMPARITAGDDPTQEFSRGAAVTLIDLLRTQAAPFMRLIVPDPFEHQRALPLQSLPPEDVAPAMTTARPALPPLPIK